MSNPAKLLLLAIAVFALTIFPPSARSVQHKPPSAEVSKQLDSAKQQAFELARDADEMTGLLNSDVSWQSHADVLNRIRDHVNNMGMIVEKLESERDEASPWQQQAIDRMVPLLKEIASNTTAAIEHLNQNHLRPVSQDYKDYIQQNADTAHELADMISSFERYDRTRTRLEKLQDKIEVTGK
jgi:NTP pyrophosphatase (non-canonical NTP hydrolase)